MLAPRPVPELPEGSPDSAHRVGEGMRLLLGLRDPRWDGKPYVFARAFAMAYCAVTDEQAKRGVRALKDCEIIERSGKSGRAILWRPGPRWHP